jgi:hypothetical protein
MHVDIEDALSREQEEKVRDIVETGTDIAGATTGTAVGFLIGGPLGAIAGAAAGPAAARTLRGLAVEFRERVLGHREEVRVGAVISFATAKIKEKLENGEQPRQDGFFTDAEDNRATAKEVFEGVVLAAQREAEEKKVRLYGNLLANLAFTQDVDRSQANFLITLGEDLSYQQLCLLSLFAQNNLLLGGNNRLNLRASDYRSENSVGMELIVLLQEIYDLYQRGIVSNGGDAMIAVADANPSQMLPVGAAANLYNLMELWTVSTDDLNPLIRLLR